MPQSVLDAVVNHTVRESEIGGYEAADEAGAAIDSTYDVVASLINAKPTEILFGYVSYGMDFLDPVNMLSVWKSGGRHSWSNPEFDKALAEAGSFPGDPTERLNMFHDVEKILVEDVPAVFIYHVKLIQLIKPWLLGEFKEPDNNCIAAAHWPGYTTMSTMPEELYIGKDAPGRG